MGQGTSETIQLQSRSDEEGATKFMLLFRLFNPEFKGALKESKSS
jgi:hypothetical protein